jgi:predicted RNase H-like HicB family nuclease
LTHFRLDSWLAERPWRWFPTTKPILDKHRPLVQISFMICTAVITEAEEGGFVAFNPETGTTTQGETFDDAMSNLREATELYLEVFPVKSKAPAVLTCFEVSHAQATGC